MQNKPNYAFIDSQNLNIGIQSQGWKLDWAKFRKYLEDNYNVEKAYLFIGQLAGQESLYEKLTSKGYELVFKPTTEHKVDGKVMVKGNVDAELVLYASAKTYRHYNQAIIVSGDGDFYCLAEYLKEQGKLGCILVPNQKFSQTLLEFEPKLKRLDRDKKVLMLHERRRSAKSQPKSKPEQTKS